METCIPFSGFYESIWSNEIEKKEEEQVEWYADEHGVEDEKVSELIWKHAKYHDCHLKIAEAYVGRFQDWLNDEYDLDITLTWKLMTNPREYNFTTDRIFVDISFDDAKKLLKAVGWHATSDAAKELFTSCSGFISFYSPDITTWGKVSEWDHNQLLAIFTAATTDKSDWDMSILEDMDTDIDNAFNNCVDWLAVKFDLDFPDNDGREYPIHDTDPARYVAAFIEKNHYIGV